MPRGREPPHDEAEAWSRVERARWDGAPPECPHCGTPGRCYYLRPADGRTRATRTGSRSSRRVWKCGACRRQFSALTGTVLQGTRIELRVWLGVLADWTGPLPPAEREIVHRYGVSRDGARHVRRVLVAAADVEPVRPPALLAALLRIEADAAARIRARAPGRSRPRPQRGPSAEYGNGE